MRRLDPYAVFLSVVATALVWSAIRPKDYGVWIFELSLGLVGVAFLIVTRSRFTLSGLVYALAALHFTILACGARYTYAEMPLFNWLRDTLHLSRNHFDRVGHLAQGFMQGDPWDAQEDMLMALIGSSASVLTLSSLHERSMAALSDPLAGATPRARA